MGKWFRKSFHFQIQTCLVLKGRTVLSRIHVSMGSRSPLPLQGMMILLVPSTAKYSVGRLSASRGWTEGGREGGRGGGREEGGRKGGREEEMDIDR